MSLAKKTALKEIYPSYAFASPDTALSGPMLRKKLRINVQTPIHIEIGFGSGEHLLHEAGIYPDRCFLGIEVFPNGVAALLRTIHNIGVNNICISMNDAAQILRNLPDNTIAAIKLPFPDPWPKKRHRKRRFVCLQNLNEIHRVLIPGGRFLFVSDNHDYVRCCLECVACHKGFVWEAQSRRDWQLPHPQFHGSRYCDKALKMNKVPIILEYRRDT
ncbi:MAG: tRNA (guanosine(46)-N7)-methyltransferase TrmB [Pseudomonadota bacterium]